MIIQDHKNDPAIAFYGFHPSARAAVQFSRTYAPLFAFTGPLSKTLDELSLVITVYDEAANIAGLLGEIEACRDGRVHYEVIVVDDGSPTTPWDGFGTYAANGDFPCGSCAMQGMPARARCYAAELPRPVAIDRDHGWRRTE